ncbi:NAD+ synthase [Marinobacter persicus]|uniref:Glutamine-dependent NAD(+) synthetase n=1 Tax=Marinobacter persicus TaxID=930118 RepID=A0A2S6G246_9GAMM|nr:NAD+ synthase [Marinobacter persicus]PPK49893.1 NAD+ synthase (glutamine-hydrolysing) [Marinobacter persicus]PPK51485.1 NAD+ synthase (glutamine-hydrolysing) [Marinobacter persicus]PPK56018.1 NAD+ synthase (glutamine-hydrolysing) [Marinobacter persicus]
MLAAEQENTEFTTTRKLRVVMAQLDFLVGDIPGNAQRIIEATRQAWEEHEADIVVFPELALTGYPPEDLLLRPSLGVRVSEALEQLKLAALEPAIVVGAPLRKDGLLYNAAVVIDGGEIQGRYLKHCPPNYQVFDEKRYFAEGKEPLVLEIRGVPVGITVCEDLWKEGPVEKTAAAGAQLVLNLNASPYDIDKQARRKALLERKAAENQVSIVYVNLVGGQDELVFDGGSMVYDHSGVLAAEAPQFAEGLFPVDFLYEHHCQPISQPLPPEPSLEKNVYNALVTGVRDYVNKNGFKTVVLGLSGGIDSALTLAVAVDALGKERVHAVMMPFRYTSSASLEDAEAEARTLGVQYDVFSIEPMYDSFMAMLAEPFAGTKTDTTEENLQARLRGVLLMSLSNKFGSLVLTTGNKSEMAVGYSTLYGDMAGGFDVLKDVPKTLVFRLARYRNTLSPAIPERVITRPPSAELAPDQKDEDSLPGYDVLDQILNLYVERDFSAEAIIAEGYAREDVQRVVRLVDINEYKRRQAPIGVRITERGFGKDRRYPITNGWKPGS